MLERLDAAWKAFCASYMELPESRLIEPGVTGDWSVKDVIAHVTVWEEEALTHLPHMLAGGRPSRYATTHGGIDGFNAQATERTRALSLADVLRRQEETHRRLVAFIETIPEEQFTRETRVRRRLRLDTYGHYPIHTGMIRTWRERTARPE
ncbi:MAG: ClbS/DfsB family four-helix bundle protein [Thermomicrobiales bacterium]|nr:ClbS/DfsB family four-helix bundle protein [Thermomicrobiales bacterium]